MAWGDYNHDGVNYKLKSGVNLTFLVGKTPIKITQFEDEILFFFEEGIIAKFYHNQDCCESVSIEDVNGNWGDLLNTPLLLAEERDGDNGPLEEYEESYTWTFYTFRSVKGSVDVRWYGSSNGYYSETVDLNIYETPKELKYYE